MSEHLFTILNMVHLYYVIYGSLRVLPVILTGIIHNRPINLNTEGNIYSFIVATYILIYIVGVLE